MDDDSSDDDSPAPARKRSRGGVDVPAPTYRPRKQTLRIGDVAQTTKYYEERLKQMQQGACKVIAKAWVKVVEPRKQTAHPYINEAKSAPPWWPEIKPADGSQGVRHKEPDHLLKGGESNDQTRPILC